MKIISWNVNGLRASVNKGLIEKIGSMDPDILCLQEIKATGEQVQEALSELNGYHIYTNSAERKGYSGTAILLKGEPQRMIPDMGIAHHDKEGRILTADLGEFYVVNAYVPNSGAELARLDYRKTWDQDMLNFLKGLEKEKPVIYCGDLNVAHKEIDIARPKANYNKTAGFTQTEIDGMDAYLSSDLVDTW
ncbi:MAG: exodeoxyribonuclease III, partial [Bacteroidota bacterium]|nr:exodeoxyribonuclease III [Bacteroidota bacterium]